MRPSDDPNCKCDFSGAEIGWCRYCMEKVWRGQQRQWARVKEIDPEVTAELSRHVARERGPLTADENAKLLVAIRQEQNERWARIGERYDL